MFSSSSSQSATGGISNSEVIIPVITSNATESWLSIFSTTGTLLGRIGFGISIAGITVAFQRYANLLYVIRQDGTTIYRFDLTTLTKLSNITSPAASNRTNWSRFSADTLLQIDTLNSRYHILNLATGNITTTTGYTATTLTAAYTGGQGLTTFYNRSSSGLTSFGSRVYWNSGQDNTNYYGETNTATATAGSSLGSRSIIASNVSNYSRMWSAVGNSSTGMLVHFDSQIYKVLSASSSSTYWSVNNATFGGNNYGFIGPYTTGVVSMCLTNALRYYGAFYRYNSTTTYYEFVLATFDFSAASGQTPTTLFALPTDSSNYNSTHCFIYQINDSGHVAIAYIDRTVSASTLKIVIVSGTTTLNTYTIDLTSTYSTATTSVCSSPNSELGVYNA